MSKIPSLVDMLKAGAHFGHQTSRRHPKMAPYIFTQRNGVHVFDLEATQVELEKTLNHIKELAASGKVVLFLGTKKQAKEAVKNAAISCKMPYLVERWIGGALTNFPEVKKRLRKYQEIKTQFETGEIERYTKKEIIILKQKMEKMEKYLLGLVGLEKMPDAVYFASLHAEKTAVAEAKKTGVEIIAVCDTNANPTKADYIIPANDDAVNSIKMMAELVAGAINEGRVEYEKRKLEDQKRADEQRVQKAPVKARGVSIGAKEESI